MTNNSMSAARKAVIRSVRFEDFSPSSLSHPEETTG